ncbi:hypothetical protein P691DRAFT_123499 [Macrolepiota fuliginosa MF-IS2]|uniref:Uncharacterized protein n=1 Tax=Macrolepiota fuliginosa MF-IS2 TaxID=1400762 RepID=A0A9P5XBT3_9AGAR|nr:hypothetical protein P691DRAFT_123499 [Macrolepiota fuliginosa MF-IS2]
MLSPSFLGLCAYIFLVHEGSFIYSRPLHDSSPFNLFIACWTCVLFHPSLPCVVLCAFVVCPPIPSWMIKSPCCTPLLVCATYVTLYTSRSAIDFEFIFASASGLVEMSVGEVHIYLGLGGPGTI